ncbi:uncharacterized protein LOC135105425 isoform X2 [Scylla paramamosain]|uniref:uncharacterized protein LOC135105425 isoform X2 n=1 Tax=Scylla paramamosain TaxID=85552 RepID=UPI003082B4DD
MDMELLISKVFEKPPLWDKRSKLHANKNVSGKLWAQVSKDPVCEDYQHPWCSPTSASPNITAALVTCARKTSSVRVPLATVSGPLMVQRSPNQRCCVYWASLFLETITWVSRLRDGLL